MVPRWMAYSGSAVSISNSGRVSPQHLTSSASFPSPSANGSLVSHYAKESSKQLAAGIVTLGDMGYEQLSRYYSELVPDRDNMQSRNSRVKEHGAASGHFPDTDNVGMVIVRDIVTRTVITQFKAHKSPSLSLCFDPSGTLLVTASVQGHSINVFRIMPGHIYFQSMLAEGFLNIGKEGAHEGEIEVERIPVRTFEARSKNLLPVYDYLKAPKFQQGRIPIMNRDNNGQLLYQGFDAAADGKLTYSSSSGSVDSTSSDGIVMAESNNGAEETGQNGLQVLTETNHGFVNTNNTRENSTRSLGSVIEMARKWRINLKKATSLIKGVINLFGGSMS